MPKEIAISICVKPYQVVNSDSEPDPDLANYKSCYEGLIFTDKANPAKGFHIQLTWSQSGSQRMMIKLDSPCTFEKKFDQATMLSKYRWFFVEEKGRVTETFVITEAEFHKIPQLEIQREVCAISQFAGRTLRYLNKIFWESIHLSHR